MTEDTDLFIRLKDDYREALEQCNDSLLRLESNPQDRDSLENASRQLHNIKGFASRMRAPKLGQLAHVFEDTLAAVSEGRFSFDQDLAHLLFMGMDLFVHYLRTREVPFDKVAEIVEEIEPLLFSAIDEVDALEDMEPLIPDFIAAARDNINAINLGLFRLDKEPADREVLREVYRNAHSLKGSSMTMGFERMGRLAHHMEDLLRALQKGRLPVTTEVCDALFETNDALNMMLDTLAVSKRMKLDVEGSVQKLVDLLHGVQHAEETRELEPGREQEPVRMVTEPSTKTITKIPAMDTVRVTTARLDELVNLASEAFVAQIRLANEIDALMLLNDRFQRLRQEENVSLYSAGADPGSDIVELGNSMDEASRRLQEAAENAGRHVESLQHRSMELRMLPLALVFSTLPRAVRDLSRQFGKQVRFEVEGEQTTIDKRILEQISDPLIHLLRNALDHGIELPEVRRRSGKSEVGTIRLQARQKGGKVLITLMDDGRGIDPHQLQQVAIKKGVVGQKKIADWTEAQLLELIFLPGLSTSGRITEISGRGVGMDVVRANVERLKGQVEISSVLGKGTSFTISLPLTLATVHALMIQCAGEILAIPTVSVLKTLQVLRSEIRPGRGGQEAIMHQEEILPVQSLAASLGWDEQDGDSLDGGRVLLVVLQAGERRTGFIVEDILGEQEIVTKDVGGHVQKVPCVAGATILGTGEVALILDVAPLLWQKQPEVR